MKTFKTIAQTIITLMIIGGFASCEKTDVAPEVPNITITVESVYDTYVLTSDKDYFGQTLYLPKGVEHSISMEVNHPDGILNYMWNMPKDYFFAGDYNSTHSWIGLNQPSFFHRSYSNQNDDPGVTEIKSILQTSTWPWDVNTDNLPPALIHFKMEDLNEVPTSMYLSIKTSEDLSGLHPNP